MSARLAARARLVRRPDSSSSSRASKTSTREVFGPVLHVVRYRADQLGELVDSINASGYGLTLGVHTRIDAVASAIAARARVGNVYVNRNMIGAQVGVQPFGGMGLSGTGPKAGGPQLFAALRDRADRDDEHRGRRRQRDAAVARAGRKPRRLDITSRRASARAETDAAGQFDLT